MDVEPKFSAAFHFKDYLTLLYLKKSNLFSNLLLIQSTLERASLPDFIEQLFIETHFASGTRNIMLQNSSHGASEHRGGRHYWDNLTNKCKIITMICTTKGRLSGGDWPSQGGWGKFPYVNDTWVEDEKELIWQKGDGRAPQAKRTLYAISVRRSTWRIRPVWLEQKDTEGVLYWIMLERKSGDHNMQGPESPLTPPLATTQNYRTPFFLTGCWS